MIAALILVMGLPEITGPFAMRADCAVPGGPAEKFTYSVRVQDGIATVTIEPVSGSSVPAHALTSNSSYIMVTQGPPSKAGTPNPDALFFNPGKFSGPDGNVGFTASGRVQAGKLRDFDFELHDPKGEIKAECTVARSPDAEGPSKQ